MLKAGLTVAPVWYPNVNLQKATEEEDIRKETNIPKTPLIIVAGKECILINLYQN